MTFLMTLLGLIPGVSSAVQAITTKWFDTKVQLYQARTGATKEIAVAAITAAVSDNQTKVAWLNAVAGSRFLQFIVGGFAFPLIVYMNKAYVWDNIVHPIFWDGYGFTPELKGLVAEWGGVIIAGIFITGTGMKIADSVISKINAK